MNTRAKKKNPSRAAFSRKRSWSWSWWICPTQCAGCLRWHRVDGRTGPRARWPTPLFVLILQPAVSEFKWNRVWRLN